MKLKMAEWNQIVRALDAGAVANLRARGFDLSKHVPFTKYYKAQCSQCAALAINGTATHERGCPNARHECNGCNALIPTNQKYCEDCQ